MKDQQPEYKVFELRLSPKQYDAVVKKSLAMGLSYRKMANIFCTAVFEFKYQPKKSQSSAE